MRPGPGTPVRGMGPRPMGSGFMQRGPGPFGGSYMNSMGRPQARFNPFNPMMGMGQPQKQGGLLAKLLGKGASAPNLGRAAVQGGTRTSAGGGLLKSLANPGSINGFLNNTQQVLKTAQQVGPMIQQYGPMVKNLPAMWRLYKGFKDLPNEEESEKTAKTNDIESDLNLNLTSKKENQEAKTTEQPKESTSKLVKKESKPKLFF